LSSQSSIIRARLPTKVPGENLQPATRTPIIEIRRAPGDVPRHHLSRVTIVCISWASLGEYQILAPRAAAFLCVNEIESDSRDRRTHKQFIYLRRDVVVMFRP
jgi:hypothetical protein